MPSAQRVQWAKIRIAVVAISAFSILAVLVYLLSGGTWLKPKAFLVTYIPDASGLSENSSVELNGVEIGTVDSLRLTKSKDLNRVVEARLKIQEDFLASIPSDSVTSIDSETMLGDKYIEIVMGKSPEHVRAGGELKFQPPANLLKSIDMEQFGVQLRAIDQVIRDIQEGKTGLGEFVTTDQMYTAVLTQIEGLEHALRSATDTHSRIGRFLYSAAIYNDIRTPLRELDERLARMQASPYLRDSAQYTQIRDRLAQIRRSLADLNSGHGAAGGLLSSDAAYREWNRRLSGWIESLDALNYGEGALGRMIANSQSYESLDGALRSLRNTLKDFRENPGKFLRIKFF